MGSAEGARKAAATRAGLSVAEYADRLNAGFLWCWRCQAWHKAAEFGSDRSRPTGRAASCKRSRNAASRARYQRSGHPGRGRRRSPARDGDRLQARRRVNYLIDAGLLPDPNDLPCTDCGHRYPDGGRRHEYDHHLGYGAEHHEDVEPVCSRCHRLREDLRRAA